MQDQEGKKGQSWLEESICTHTAPGSRSISLKAAASGGDSLKSSASEAAIPLKQQQRSYSQIAIWVYMHQPIFYINIYKLYLFDFTKHKAT